MRRFLLLIPVAVLLVVASTACEPDPGPTGLYRGPQASITPTVTPKASPIVWGSAPNIDANYGKTLYAGTGIAVQDPRPPLVNGRQQLRMWVAKPNNALTKRPAILWFHGGGFAVGLDSMYGLANTTGKEYAKRGYVSIAVEYRSDSTLVGTGARPPSLCQWVQDYTGSPTDATYLARKAQCGRNITAAQEDSLAAIRWVKANAATYGIDPNMVAVAGFSAGAVISYSTAYQWDATGTNSYFTGDPRTAAASKPRAAMGASGFLPTADGLAPTTIGTNDVPTSFIASRFDQAAAYPTSAQTVRAARAVGITAELTSYCTERAHANDLYDDHKAATDDQWTTFLVRELFIDSGGRPVSADPICSGV